MVWYSYLLNNFPQFIVIHTVKDFSIVNKAEIDVFLELSCFFNDPVDVGNLILYNEHKFAFSCMWFLLLAHADFRMLSRHSRKYTIVDVKKKKNKTKQKSLLFGYWKIYLSSFDLFPLGYLYYGCVTRMK